MSNESRVVIGVDEDDETLGAVALGDGRYRIDNVPFFAYNVSLGDVVEARGKRLPRVRRVVEKSGHRTVRVVLPEEEGLEGPTARPLIQAIERLGCQFEGFAPMLLAIDVPPEVKIDQVVSTLEQAGVEWEYADPQPDRPPAGEDPE